VPQREEERPSRVFRRSRRYTQECRRLGLRVRQLRHEREMTLEVASARASLDITHLQKIEAGKLNLTMVTLIRLADGLGVRIADLFAEESSGASGKK
jgi:transcriptional regulator with XRE-family HTH domain